MTTYAFFITAILFFVIGVMAHASFEEWQDGRTRAKCRKAKAKNLQASRDFDRETIASMDEAVALVKEKMGGEVIAIDPHTS